MHQWLLSRFICIFNIKSVIPLNLLPYRLKYGWLYRLQKLHIQIVSIQRLLYAQNIRIADACFGGPAYSMSMNNMCSSGLVVVNGYCCPCSSGQVLGTPCVNNLCPNMYTCNVNLNVCCPSAGATVAATVPVTTPAASMVMSVGPCVNGVCIRLYDRDDRWYF
jgi:hypothetical protein